MLDAIFKSRETIFDIHEAISKSREARVDLYNAIFKSRKERIDNARLAMSYCRKFGQELFVLPEHLTGMDSKAVLSMFAAIMTVGMTDNAYTGKGGDKSVNDALMGY